MQFNASSLRRSHRRVRSLGGVIVVTLATPLTLISCAASNTGGSPQSAEAPASSPSVAADQSQELAQDLARTEAAIAESPSVEVPKAAPQLIKTATISLRVEDVPKALESVSTLVKAQRGDILQLQDQRPQQTGDRHRATLALRVPQAQLDTTLEALGQLGSVQAQGVEAEDVSNQIVDAKARLKNLRKSEEVVLGIMERSGSVGDVLKVSQDLERIRSSIEQLDAQVQDLSQRVAYSTVRITLENEVIASPPSENLGTQLQETWSLATHGVSSLTVGLIKLILFLAAFSPYWGSIVVLIWFLNRRAKQHRQPQPPAVPPEPLAPQ
jgi:hypothetical protein